MKQNKIKLLLIISFLTISLFLFPAIAFAEEEEGDEDVEDSEQYGAFENYQGGFGGVFRDNMGYGGQLIGSLFEMLLLDGVDLEDNEMIDDVYVLSASKEDFYEGEYDFNQMGDTEEIKYLPYYNNTEGAKPWEPNTNFYDESDIDGIPYCRIQKEGGFDYNLTIGAGLTLIIWDTDKSFINAAQKILDWAVRFREAEDDDAVTPKIVAEGVQVLSWLFIHINDIFTGDELFVFNPIVWQTLDLNPWKGTSNDFNITRTWMQTGSDDIIGGIVPDTPVDSDVLDQWSLIANWTKDSYMQWLLGDYDDADIAETLWTQFSFDLAQLWMKKFYVEIDLEELSKGEDAKMKKVFEGCDIEFYLFTHHLAGAFLYNDTDSSNHVTVEYDYLRNYTAPTDQWVEEDGELKPPIIYTNGTAAMIPTTNEITHRLILADVGDFDFKEPKIDEDDKTVEWGLQLNDANMSAVPVAVDLDSFMKTEQEHLDYIYFGLDFELDKEDPTEEGEIEAEGDVKLETNWAPWNDGKGPNNQDVSDGELDMALVYVSSILHFELDMERDDDPEDPEEGDYEHKEHTLEIGNYIDEDEDDLEFVDIAGPGYWIGNETDRVLRPANTSNIHLALWQGSSQMRETDPGDEDDTTDDHSTDINAEAQWEIMLYAVCYPDFNGTGLGIWHDPTFSVYMVFTPEEPSFWALIILIAAVGLAGVATIIIKRRKDGTW